MISIIVPVYNSRDTLERCIDSILNQTFQYFELIIVDDGSVDDSWSIINQYSEKDVRIIPLSKENGGVGSARNMGIESAHGEYVCFVDSDDYVSSHYLEDLVNCIEEWDVDLAMCLINKTPKERFSPETFFEDNNMIINSILLQKEQNAGPYNKLFKRSIIDNLRFNEDIYMGEDTLFCVEYAKKCRNAIRCNKILYYYDIPTSSAAYLADKSKLWKILTVIDSRIEMLKHTEMIAQETVLSIIDSMKKLFRYVAILGVTNNSFTLLSDLSRKLRWVHKKYKIGYNGWSLLLAFSPNFYYCIRKISLKSEALMSRIIN